MAAKKKAPPKVALKKTTGPVSNRGPSPGAAGAPPRKMASPKQSKKGGGLGSASNVSNARRGGASSARSAAGGGGIGASGGTRLPTRAYSAPTEHTPNHTFAASTMPRTRGGPKRHNPSVKPGDTDSDEILGANTTAMASPHDVAAHPNEPDADDAKLGKQKLKKSATLLAANAQLTGGRAANASARRTSDDEQKPGTPYRLRAAMPTQSTELAAAKQGMGFKAAAASAAKSAGVSPQAGAAMVAAASQKASKKARAKNPNLTKVAKKGQTKGPGGKFS